MPGRRRSAKEVTELGSLAQQHGLAALGVRPKLPEYVASVWSRRAFLWTLTLSRVSTRHGNTYLGQIWLVLNPLLLATTYYLVFGLLLRTKGGVENYIGFLVIGIFIYSFISSTVNASADAIAGNLKLIQALQFPRATLPLSMVLSEAIVLVPALGVMAVITLASGERPAWSWVLVPAALLIVTMFNAGIAFIAARVIQSVRDLKNVIPVMFRLLRYVSGVFFSVQHYVGDTALGHVLQFQPIAVYLSLFRECLLGEFTLDPALWLAGAGWAIGTFALGLLIFWTAEAEYGRD